MMFTSFSIINSVPQQANALVNNSSKSSVVKKITQSKPAEGKKAELPKPVLSGIGSMSKLGDIITINVTSTGYTKNVNYKVLVTNSKTKKIFEITKGYSSSISPKKTAVFKYTAKTAGDYYITVFAIGTGVKSPILSFTKKTLKVKVATVTAVSVDKEALNTAVAGATTLIGSKIVGVEVGNVPQSAKDAFQTVINEATAVKNNAKATQAEVNAQVTLLEAATTDFNNEVVTVAPVDKSGLNTSIASAITLMGSKTVGIKIGNVPQSAKDAFQSAINAATAVKNNEKTTQVEVNAQVTALEVATTVFNNAVVIADKAVLNSALTNAITLIGSKTVGSGIGNVPQSAKDAFQSAINAATTVENNEKTTQAEVNAQVTALETATTVFNNAVVTADKAVLNSALTNAITLIESKTVGSGIGNVPQSAKNAFQTSINTATTVKNNKDATQAEVNAQVTALGMATTAFNNAVIAPPPYIPPAQAQVVLKSIAITTPATKLVYIVGDTLDIAGLKVEGTYSDGSTKVESITMANVTGFNSTVAVVNQTLTVTVGGKTVTYTITINTISAKLDVNVSSQGNKTVFIVTRTNGEISNDYITIILYDSGEKVVYIDQAKFVNETCIFTTQLDAGTYHGAVNSAKSSKFILSGVVVMTPDTTAPAITLIGNATVNVANGVIYTDEGATVTDNLDTGLKATVTYTKDGASVELINTAVAGTYVVHYNASDAAGNAAIEVIRTVIVQP
jgi:hypothetical protein